MTDDFILIKYKQAGLPDDVIAAKMGITVQEIQKRWDTLLEESRKTQVNGYDEITTQFNALCFQFQLLGEGLKHIGNGLASVRNSDNLKAHFSQKRKLTDQEISLIEEICQSFIVLSPYKAIDPSESLREAFKHN